MIPRPEDYPHWIAWRDAVTAHERDGAPEYGAYDDPDEWIEAYIKHHKARDPFAGREHLTSGPDLESLSDFDRRWELDAYRKQLDRERDDWFREAWNAAHPEPSTAELAVEAGATIIDGRISFPDTSTLETFATTYTGREMQRVADAIGGCGAEADRKYARQLYARWERITQYGGQKNAQARARRAIDEHCTVRDFNYGNGSMAPSTAEAVDAEINAAIFGGEPETE